MHPPEERETREETEGQEQPLDTKAPNLPDEPPSQLDIVG